MVLTFWLTIIIQDVTVLYSHVHSLILYRNLVNHMYKLGCAETYPLYSWNFLFGGLDMHGNSVKYQLWQVSLVFLLLRTCGTNEMHSSMKNKQTKTFQFYWPDTFFLVIATCLWIPSS